MKLLDFLLGNKDTTSGEMGQVRAAPQPLGVTLSQQQSEAFGVGVPQRPTPTDPVRPQTSGFLGDVREATNFFMPTNRQELTRSGDMPQDRAVSPLAPNGMYDPRVAKQIIDKFVAAGYDPRFAAGMAANAMIESSGNPTAYNKAEGAFGLFQHRLDRLDNMRDFADRLGKDINDISTQVSFAIHEFGAGERMAYDRIMGYGDGQSAAQYAKLIDQYWERSDGSARDKRASLATEIYSDFFGQDGAYTNEQPILSFGTDIDPYGTQDNVAMLRDFDPSLMSMGTGAQDFANVADYYSEAQGGQPPTQAPVPTAAEAASEAEASRSLLGVVDPTSNPQLDVAAGPPASDPVQKVPTGEDTESPRFLQGFLDKIYGTPDITDDERRIRRRAMAQAFTEGLGYLQGRPVNMEGVYNRAAQGYEQIADRRTEQGKAQALATMATNMGLGQLAGLAYLDEGGRNSLTQAMVSSVSSKGSGAQYELDEQTREGFATQVEASRPDLAQALRNPSVTGKALEDVVQQAINGAAPTSGDKQPLPAAASFANYLEEQGADPALVDAARNASTSQELKTAMDAAMPQDDDKSAAQRNFEYRQDLPEELRGEFDRLIGRSSGAPEPENNYQIRAISQIEQDDERINDLVAKGRRIERNMDLIRQLAMDPDFESGILQGSLLLPVQNLATSLGIDLDILKEEGGPLRLIDAMSREMATLAREQGAGSTSNFDAKNYIATGPRATDTRKQILLLSQFHKYAAQQNQEVQALRDQYFRENANTADYYDNNKLTSYIEENMTRKQIFPEIVVQEDDTPETMATKAQALVDSGQLMPGDVFITIMPDKSYGYNAYRIPGWND